MLSHHDTARRFVEKGGIALLLRLYTLPNLPLGTGAAAQGLSGGAPSRGLSACFYRLPIVFEVFVTGCICILPGTRLWLYLIARYLFFRVVAFVARVDVASIIMIYVFVFVGR